MHQGPVGPFFGTLDSIAPMRVRLGGRIAEADPQAEHRRPPASNRMRTFVLGAIGIAAQIGLVVYLTREAVASGHR